MCGRYLKCEISVCVCVCARARVSESERVSDLAAAMPNCDRVVCRHPSCNRSFESHDSMKQHFSVCHSKKEQEQKYACKLCNKSKFKNKGGLQDHIRTVHLNNYDTEEDNNIAPHVLQSDQAELLQNVACNDCGRTTFKSVDALHQHQWNSPGHTHVSKSSNPNNGTRVRTCSQCCIKLPTPEDLEQHFVEQHPISEVLKSGEERQWQQVEGRFRSAWTKPTIKLYEVHRIFKVYNPGWRRRNFEEYRKEIKKEMSNQKKMKEDNDELRNKVLHDGNELQRYHGTTVKCRLGRPPKPDDNGSEALSLCEDGECSLCRILQTGFKKSKCRVKNFQRFGKGIYCSSSSSKSSAYVKCSASAQKTSNSNCFFSCFGGDESTNRKKNYKVMMVCRVIAGRPYHSTQNIQNLKGPPRGYHSVQGDPGENLNYDELVVYNDRAILPAYIILYTSND